MNALYTISIYTHTFLRNIQNFFYIFLKILKYILDSGPVSVYVLLALYGISLDVGVRMHGRQRAPTDLAKFRKIQTLLNS